MRKICRPELSDWLRIPHLGWSAVSWEILLHHHCPLWARDCLLRPNTKWGQACSHSQTPLWKHSVRFTRQTHNLTPASLCNTEALSHLGKAFPNLWKHCCTVPPTHNPTSAPPQTKHLSPPSLLPPFLSLQPPTIISCLLAEKCWQVDKGQGPCKKQDWEIFKGRSDLIHW
jgi:hypothetical protein